MPPGEEARGDCFSACLASILECPLEDVPVFSGRPGTWTQDVNDWLRPRGYFMVGYSVKGECTPSPPDFHIVSGPTARDPESPGGHAIIARCDVPIHDPSRTGECIEEIQYRWIIVPFGVGTTPSALRYVWYRDRTVVAVIALALVLWIGLLARIIVG